MGMAQNDIVGVGATHLVVGLSQVIRFTPAPMQYAETLKWISGGSLEIVPVQLSGTSTAAGNAWGVGYILGTTEIFNIGGPAVFYLAATGATAVASMTLGYTPGATLL